LKALDGVHCGCLGIEQDSPHVAGHVVDEEEVAPASRCNRCHGATEVTVYDLQLLGAEARLAREGEPPQLGE
jgi:hypothetical protein